MLSHYRTVQAVHQNIERPCNRGYRITLAQLLRELGELGDCEQLVLLAELQRFLLHPSLGVKVFDQMPAAWSDLCTSIAAGGTANAKKPVS